MLERQVQQDFRDLQVRLAKLDPRVTPEPQDRLARLVRRGRRAWLARAVLKAARVLSDQQVQRDHRDLVAQLAPKA